MYEETTMVRQILTASMLAGMASTVMADYCFPSANPPGGKRPSEVKQYISIIWDDNQYSGKKYTQYEAEPGAGYKKGSMWVGGQINEGGWQGTKPNDMSWSKNGEAKSGLQEGDMGMSWGARTLAGIQVPSQGAWDAAAEYSTGTEVIYNDTIWQSKGWPGAGNAPKGVTDADKDLAGWELNAKYPWEFLSAVDHSRLRTNHDGSNIEFTFNVITGLMVPVWPKTWQSRESKLGYWVNQGAIDYVDGYAANDHHTKIAIAWGREQQILESEGGAEFQASYILQSFQEAQAAGHEIGNHTIDHMESNSPLAAPSDASSFPGKMAFHGKSNSQYGFDRWNGEGFDYSEKDTMPWNDKNGNPVVHDEAADFGQKPGASAQFMGWKIKAGKYISKKAWKEAILLGEEQLDEYMDISVAKGNCFAFRAPRLEVSSGLYYALAELGYQYDCGLEEGYESHIDGTNYYWPYTVDNGSANGVYQRSIGEAYSVDSFPTSLWQIPSNVFTVPEAHRADVYDNHTKVNANAIDGGDIESFESWTNSGAKITGYDFNLYILWGMTKDAWLATMKYNTQLRLDNNKAPLHYGAHTDYYSPIYDNATLLGEANRPGYGQCIDSGWNTWVDRVESMEEWVDWAVGNECNFISGHQLIEEVKKMQAGEKFGTESPLNADWEFFSNSALNSSTTIQNAGSDIVDAKITVASSQGDNTPNCHYAYYNNVGSFSGLDHISFDYSVSAPISVRLSMESGESYEVNIGNLNRNGLRNSGRIPLTAFHQNQYSGVVGYLKDTIDTEKINGIKIYVLTGEREEETHDITVKNFKLFKGAPHVGNVAEAALSTEGLAVQNLTSEALTLNIAEAGNYSVSLLSANGRVVKSISAQSLTAGINTIALDNIATGMYFVNIEAAGIQKSFKTVLK